MKNNILISLFFGLLAILPACKKDKPAVVYGEMNLHIHLNFDSNEIENYGEVYSDSQGRKTQFSNIQFYISHIQLIKLDGSVVEAPVKHILKTLENEEFSIGQVPVGNYKSVRFYVGLDSIDDGIEPNNSGDTLFTNHPEMFMPSTNGNYKYFRIDGNMTMQVDSTRSSFWIYLGTAKQYVQVVMPDQPFAVYANQANWCHIIADMDKLLYPYDSTSPMSYDITDAQGNAQSFADIWPARIKNMFRYE